MNLITETLFREEYPKLVAIYCHRYGTEYLDLIEDAIQDAFYRAMQLWTPGFPEKPRAWLYTVSKNRLLDQIKAQKPVTDPYMAMSDWPTEEMTDLEIKDNKLKMMFACCHPELSINDQLLLNLKFLCGFSNRQIARALIKSPAAIEKAGQRAKQRFQVLVNSLDIPSLDILKERLDGTIKVIYLQFTEGYKHTEGDELVSKELCIDAIKLAELITSFKELNTPAINAILALMYFQASRLDARQNSQGEPLLLEEQDRSKWNYHFILQGDIYLGRSATGNELSIYHLEAAIASYHAVAASFQETNWAAIFDLYGRALELLPNPNYRLNMLVAYSYIGAASDCLQKTLSVEDELPTNHYTQIFLGDLYNRLQNSEMALLHYRRALNLATHESEKRFIKRKLNSQDN